MQDDSCDIVRVGMRYPIIYWGRRRAEARGQHSHDGYRGGYGKNTQRHLRKSPALLAGACFAHMRRLYAPRGLGLSQWTLAHAAPLRLWLLKADTRSDVWHRGNGKRI
jgi:hypothetical protein